MEEILHDGRFSSRGDLLTFFPRILLDFKGPHVVKKNGVITMDSIKNDHTLPLVAGRSEIPRPDKDDAASPGGPPPTPPRGESPAPDPPPPPPLPDGFTPFGPAYSIPAYGTAALHSTMIGLKEYAHLFTSSTAAPAPAAQPGTAATTAVSSVGTWMSGFATGLLYLKSGHELYYGIKGRNEAKIVEGGLDFLIGSATLTSAIPTLSTFGALSTGILLGVKVMYDALKERK
jgi:hypothetical protein